VDSPADIDQLEQRLAPLSHGDDALVVLQEFLKRLGSWRERQKFLNTHLVCAPIHYEAVKSRLPIDPGPFFVLQGDIIRTHAAFSLGEHPPGASYAIATSTCDLMPSYGRETILLLPVVPVSQGSESEEKLRRELGNLVSFRPKRYFYLPPLPDDAPDVLFNVVQLDPFAQARKEDIIVAERRASMTLIGWRVFGALLRSLEVREGAEEVDVRRLGTEAYDGRRR
jgi:hypothetical protein